MRIMLVAFCLIYGCKLAAQNLLANGSFEDENICTEYRINCSPEAWVSASPSFLFYFRDPKLAYDGEHMMGLMAGHAIHVFKRTYIRTPLLCGLKKGNTYRIRLFIRSPHNFLDSAGIYFTDYDFLYEKSPFYKIIPSRWFADAIQKPVAGNSNWQEVVLDYQATGNEAYLTIGYFAKKDLKGSTGIGMENNFLFYVDDVSMVARDPSEKLCPDWHKIQDSVYAINERHEFLELLINRYRNQPQKRAQLSPTVSIRIDTLIIPDILFTSGSAQLNLKIHPQLDSFCTAINRIGFDSLQVAGHTDSIGSLEKNNQLSADRANAVADYILQKFPKANTHISIQYFAFSKPVASNSTAPGRQKNRRVEILLYRHQ